MTFDRLRTIRLESEVDAQLAAYAEREGFTISEVVRLAVEAYLAGKQTA
jgi:predicted DNA-binding protein